ncbi:MAG TPA: hypothetical protein VLU25_16720 [Acidobacteriota bacterium]|nr:hypothetical protein [Acidobacteriota bacterium]
MAERIWTRRRFIAAVSAAGGFALGRVSVDWIGRPERLRNRFRDRLLALLQEVDLQAEVGSAYLQENPSQADLDVLSQLLLQRLDLAGWWTEMTGLPDQQALRQALSAAISQDFQRADGICRLNGWYLSQTECRLAAMRVVARGQGLISDVAKPVLAFPEADLYEVGEWGPRTTPRGESFNQQPDGGSAFWFHIAGAPPSLKIFLGRREMKVTIHPDLVTASLAPEDAASIVRNPGRHAVVAADPQRQLQQTIGEFQVLEGAADSPANAVEGPLEVSSLPEMRLKEVAAWGPQSTVLGQPFNPQPSGASAFWIDVEADRTESALRVYLGNHPLRTTVNAKVITASISPEEVSSLLGRAGNYPLYLVSRARSGRQKVGDFEVKAR